MIEIFSLFYKKCLSSKVKRKYYNMRYLSWKSLFLLNFLLMIIFYLILDTDLKTVQFMQAIISGIFISVLAYVATVVIPEREQVKSIVRRLETEVRERLRSTFDENCYEKEHITRTYRYHIIPLLKSLEAQFSTISRDVGMVRCTKEETSLFTYISTLDELFKGLIELIDDPENNKTDIENHVESIKKIYTQEILPRCKELKKYYFL
jgi:hypothetical protein